MPASVLSIRKAIVLWAVCSLALGIFHFSNVGRAFEYQVFQRINFYARQHLVPNQWLDSRIKVFGLDTKAVAGLEAEGLEAAEWNAMLTAVCRNQPSVVLIAAPFLLPPGKDSAALARLKKTISECAPIIARAVATSDVFPNRARAPLSSADYDLRQWVKSGDSIPFRLRPDVVYAPDAKLADVLPRLGHSLFDHHGLIEPLAHLGGNLVLPHWSIFAAKKREIRDGRLYLDDREVPLNYRGRIIVNFREYWVYGQRILPLTDLLGAAKSRVPLPSVAPNDVVVLLPQLLPGQITQTDTPLGVMPEEFVNLSVVNSALTGDWLKVLPRPVIALCLFTYCAIGAALGFFLSPLLFWIGLTVLCCGTDAIGLLSFMYANWVLPWGICAIGLFVTALVVFLEKARLTALRARQLKVSLEGMIEPSKLDRMLKAPHGLHFTPSNQRLSLVFIDIVGFSRSAENRLPDAVFASLKEVLGSITETVHQHGGIVDKTLGDGLLCFFGYDWDGNPGKPDHAEAALRCAMQVQRDSLARNLGALERNQPVYPLRIGINTSEVHVGDLGGRSRIEFTVIGHGVNFAQRLQASCEGYAVMCGTSTCQDVQDDPEWRPRILKRWIKVKHREDLVEAFEIDPFSDDPKLLDRGIEAYRTFAGLSREETRWRVHHELKVLAGPNEGRVADFSLSGLAVELNAYYGRGVTLPLAFRTPNQKLESELARAGIHVLEAEVQWGKRIGDNRFLHGLSVRGLSSQQKESLVNIVKAWLGEQNYSVQPDALAPRSRPAGLA